MKKGCLILFVILIAASIIEYFLLLTHRPDVSPWLGILLGLGVAIVVANFHGITSSIKQKRLLAKSPSEWRDGELIGISGRINVSRDPLHLPASGQSVAIYEYDVKRTVVSGSGKNRSTTTTNDFSGFGMANCSIQSKRGAVKLIGYPMLAHFPKKFSINRTEIERMGDYLATAKLTPKEKGIGGALKQINEVLKDADGEVHVDFIDGGSATDPTQPDFKEAYMAEGYSIEETFIETGVQITAFGTYRANPPRLDVGGIFDNFSHIIFPGEGQSVTSKNFMKSLIAFVIFAAITAAGHYFLLGQAFGWK